MSLGEIRKIYYSVADKEGLSSCSVRLKNQTDLSQSDLRVQCNKGFQMNK